MQYITCNANIISDIKRLLASLLLLIACEREFSVLNSSQFSTPTFIKILAKQQCETAKKCLYCVVPENIHTPPTEGIGISRGVGGEQRPRKILSGGGGVVSIYIIFSRPVPLILYVKFSVCICLPIRGRKH